MNVNINSNIIATYNQTKIDVDHVKQKIKENFQTLVVSIM